MSIVVTSTLLVSLCLGGWLSYSYYKMLGGVKKIEQSLGTVHRYRGANRVTRERILKNTLEKLRGAGGRLETRDIALEMSALTTDNGQHLPRMMRTKLSLMCHVRKLHRTRDNRIDRIKRRFVNARRGNRTEPRPPPPPVAAPDVSGGLGCSADRLAELDYTFVRVKARVVVKRGLFSRTVSVNKTFFLPQPPPSSDSGDEDDSNDDDDE